MEISFVLTWWVLCLLIIGGSFIGAWLYSRDKDTHWDPTPAMIVFTGLAISIGIAIGQLF